MKITKECIEHNAFELINEVICNVSWEDGTKSEMLGSIVNYIDGIIVLANELKKVLDA